MKPMKHFILRLVLLGALLGAASARQAVAADNELTAAEKAAGWQLLFDGRSTTGWMSPKGKPLPQSHVQDGALNPHPCDYMLVFENPLDDYELALEFKISPKCNSGIFVRTWPLEPRPGKDVGFNGIEIAIDDTTTTDFHDTGALYDLVKPTANLMKPAGEWNTALVMSRGPKLEVAINGRTVSAIDFDQWLWNNMPCAAKPLTKTRHGHDNLHKISNCVDSGVCLELLKPNELIEFKSLR